MSKKLVTKDEKIVTKVENALANGAPYAKFKAKDGNTVIAVCNKHGEILKKAVEGLNIRVGVLRGHPEYCVPTDMMTKLAERAERWDERSK